MFVLRSGHDPSRTYAEDHLVCCYLEAFHVPKSCRRALGISFPSERPPAPADSKKQGNSVPGHQRRPVGGQGPPCQLSRRAPEATRSRVLLRCSIHYEKYLVELEAPPKVRPSVHRGWTSRYNKRS